MVRVSGGTRNITEDAGRKTHPHADNDCHSEPIGAALLAATKREDPGVARSNGRAEESRFLTAGSRSE